MPLAHPAPRCLIRARRGEQLVARRQIQDSTHARESSAPAVDGHRAPRLGPTDCLNCDIATPEFDAGQAFLAAIGDQEIFVIFGRTQHSKWSGHVEAPSGAHGAANFVTDDKTCAIEIEPHLARQVELIVRRHNAPTALDQGE